MFAALALSALLVQPSLGDVEGPTVLVFTTTDCPIANRYAPEIERLAAKFKGRVQFMLVYPVPTDTPDLIREHVKKFAYSIPTLRDNGLALVRRTGVKVTPEVAVLVGQRVVYRGRIDDRYVDLGKDRQVATRHDLELALDSINAGRPVAIRETQAVGCILSDLIK